jgi:hypothetical protein
MCRRVCAAPRGGATDRLRLRSVGRARRGPPRVRLSGALVGACCVLGSAHAVHVCTPQVDILVRGVLSDPATISKAARACAPSAQRRGDSAIRDANRTHGQWRLKRRRPTALRAHQGLRAHPRHVRARVCACPAISCVGEMRAPPAPCRRGRFWRHLCVRRVRPAGERSVTTLAAPLADPDGLCSQETKTLFCYCAPEPAALVPFGCVRVSITCASAAISRYPWRSAGWCGRCGPTVRLSRHSIPKVRSQPTNRPTDQPT